MSDTIHTGGCLCGAVRYTAKNLSDIWYCHCTQCQKLTGLYVSAAGAKRADISIKGDVNWRPISRESRSGHCPECGSYLFWDMSRRPTLSVMSGSLDTARGLEVKGHIFVKYKPDHIILTDGLPQYDDYPPEGTRSTGA